MHRFKSAFALLVCASINAYTPTIKNPSAPNAQNACPGYTASNVQQISTGVTATLTLAGSACNAYGTDIASLTLTVQYQDIHRLNVNIQPTYLVSLVQYAEHSLANESGLSKSNLLCSRRQSGTSARWFCDVHHFQLPILMGKHSIILVPDHT